MAEDYSEDILFRVVAQICQMVGFEIVSSSALYVLTDILRQLILSIGKRARSYSELCGRTNFELSDLLRAFSDLTLNSSDLVTFLQTVGPLPTPIRVPKYPVTFKRSEQHFADIICSTIAPTDFKSENLMGCLASNKKITSPSQEFDHSNYNLGLSGTLPELKLQSDSDDNVIVLQNHNSSEGIESLKLRISLAQVKKACKIKKLKKDSKKQKKQIHKSKNKKNKKSNKREEASKNYK